MNFKYIFAFLILIGLGKKGTSSPNDKAIHLAIDALIEKANEKLDHAPDTSFIFCQKALKLAENEEYHEASARVHQLLGEIFYLQGAFGQSLPHYLKSVDYFEQTQDKIHTANGYHQLGKLYYYTKQPELAFENQLKALQIYSQAGDSLGIAKIYGSLGHLHEKNIKYDSALFYQNKALIIYQYLSDSSGLAIIHENIGSIYEDLEEFDQAFKYFYTAQRYNENRNNESAQIGSLNNLGDIYRKTDQTEKGIKYTRRSLQLAQKLDQKYKTSSAYRDLGKAYSLLGKTDSAYYYLNESIQLYENIYSKESARQITLLQTLFEIEQKNGEIELLEQNQRLDQLTKLAILLVVISIVLIATMILSRQRLKIRKNRELIEERDNAYQAKHQLMQAEIDNKQLAEERLHAEIKAKSKELTTHTLHAITKNQILEELKVDIQEILKDESARHRKDLKKLIRKIDTNFQRDDEWKNFKKMFTKVHESFYDQLSEHFPDLTQSEKRLASLIKLNITSRDIATIMAISSDSLRIARYRLRKKMGIERNVKLETFIQNI